MSDAPAESRPGADRRDVDTAPSLLIVATVPATIRGFLVPIAAHMRSQGWRVEAASSGLAGDQRLSKTFAALHDVPLSRSIRDVGGLLRSRRALGGVIADGSFDVVHVHTPIASFVTRYAVRRIPAGKRPAVAYTAHGFHFHPAGGALTNLAFRTAEQIAGRWTDRLVVINEDDAAAARRHRIVPPSRLVHMPGIGIDTEFFSPDAVEPSAVDAVRAAVGRGGAPIFVLVGEFSPNKRHRDVLDAMARMRNRDAIVVFAGEGPGRDGVRRHARDLGLESRVHFAGFVQDVRPLILASVALILPSGREGLARSVMEALSLGVPVVASTARGNRELVGDGSGFIVPTGDVAALGERMDWLIDHPDEHRAMGVEGRRRMRDTFDLRHVLALHDGLYRDLLSESRERQLRADLTASRAR